ncbi:Hypothetical protein, putative [Bodo saltans]|uniref:Uncharacterized protein n=1 Tax=Bodo saltans TaxID=75058 RepID=A0A0S4KIK9_BODSA|nr:Hypothetical protein, putative [Bodo saltans]|eukprot:CUI14404.1 Hypothetical protein, putative [Bodo saltans]
MDALKGLARRATQTFREKVSNADSTSDGGLIDTTKKVRQFEKTAVTLSDKVLRVAKLIEELGSLVRDIGEEYKQMPDLFPETQQLADDTLAFGTTLVQKAQEHQAPLKDHAFDLLGNFIKDIQKMRDIEEDRKKKQLEYDFFRQKVLELRKSPPKDFTRIPRNEQILETWRTELWKSTEANKAIVSMLFSQGQRAIDQSVLTVGQVLNSFLNIAASGAKHTYGNARLPLYPVAPLLTPAPLPPNPLPPFQYPNTTGQPPAPVNYAPSGDYNSPNPPHSQQWQQPQPPQQHQQQPAWGQQQQPPQQNWGQQQQPQQPQHQQQQQPPSWNPQPQNQAPQQPAAWATPQQQPQHQQQQNSDPHQTQQQWPQSAPQSQSNRPEQPPQPAPQQEQQYQHATAPAEQQQAPKPSE